MSRTLYIAVCLMLSILAVLGWLYAHEKEHRVRAETELVYKDEKIKRLAEKFEQALRASKECNDALVGVRKTEQQKLDDYKQREWVKFALDTKAQRDGAEKIVELFSQTLGSQLDAMRIMNNILFAISAHSYRWKNAFAYNPTDEQGRVINPARAILLVKERSMQVYSGNQGERIHTLQLNFGDDEGIAIDKVSTEELRHIADSIAR